MAKPVVITRPAAQAAPLAEKIAALGRQALIFPLLEILPLPDLAPLKVALDDVSRYAMVAFVSPNAIDAAFSVRANWPADIVFAVVGEGSRKALAAHGVTDRNARIVSPANLERSDSETLLETLDKFLYQDKQVLIVRGETGRELLADALQAAGAKVTKVAAYRRCAPHLDFQRQAKLAQLLKTKHVWIITSSEALRNLVQMAQALAGAAGVAKLQQQELLVPHARIGETARMLGFHNIKQTASGDEGLLAALQSCP